MSEPAKPHIDSEFVAFVLQLRELTTGPAAKFSVEELMKAQEIYKKIQETEAVSRLMRANVSKLESEVTAAFLKAFI